MIVGLVSSKELHRAFFPFEWLEDWVDANLLCLYCSVLIVGSESQLKLSVDIGIRSDSPLARFSLFNLSTEKIFSK